MQFQLANLSGDEERMKGNARQALGQAAYHFFFPPGTSWDAALDGSMLPSPPIPSPDQFRAGRSDVPLAEFRSALNKKRRQSVPGSNGWLLDGSLSSSGAALLANNTHLGIDSIPGPWYRLCLHWKEVPSGDEYWAVGATIPGLPMLPIGSNGFIAWGFTNGACDSADVVTLEQDPDNPRRYRTPDGWKEIDRREETYHVAGGPTVVDQVETSIWGPLYPAESGRPRQALCAVAHNPAAMNLAAFNLMRIHSVDEALTLAPTCGAPPLNLLVGDREGRIGWTILGRLPRRVGFDGGRPTSWADGTRRWDGFLPTADYPRRGSPEMKRIWSSNQRMLAPEAYPCSSVEGHFFDGGARARQVRDDLCSLTNATPADMLKIEMDNRAVYHEGWQHVLLEVARQLLNQPHDPDVAAVLREVQQWGGRAATNSVGYRMVWQFADEAFFLLHAPAREACQRVNTNFLYYGPTTDEPIWRLVTERPPHLLNPRFPTYDALLETAVTNMLNVLRKSDGPVTDRTWGELNTLQIRHPFSRMIPALSRWLDLPGGPMPGDWKNMPCILNPAYGASERFAVSPGHEEEGFFTMTTGESGHFLSPYYRAGTREWLEAKTLPLLPGPAEHELNLSP